MKYCRQPDNYSCGPTAIINAMKWAGMDASLKSHLPFLQFGCHTIDLECPDPENNGTTDWDFDRVLRYVAKGTFTVNRKKKPSFKELKAHLEKGHAACMSYHWEENNQIGDHFCFIEKLERGLFVCVNDHNAANENTVTYRSDKTIQKWLKKGDEYPFIWLLRISS